MKKNSRIEVGKTPADDSDGKKCTHIKDGNPVIKSADNCFEKISSLVYNVSDKLKDEESSEVSDGENGDNSLA